MIVIFNSLLESLGVPLTWLDCKSMVLKGLKILHFKADHHNMLSIQLVLKMNSFSLQLHSSLPHQQQYSPPKKSKTTAAAPPPQVTEPGPSTIPPLRTRLPLEPSAHHFCFSIDLRSISNLEVSSPVNCYLRWVDNRNCEGRLSKSPLFFFLVGYAILKDFSYLFGVTFTGRKFFQWCHHYWPIGQWVIFHAAPNTAYVNHFFPMWIYNIIQIHSGKTSWLRDFVACSVAVRPRATKFALHTFKELWEVDLQVYFGGRCQSRENAWWAVAWNRSFKQKWKPRLSGHQFVQRRPYFFFRKRGPKFWAWLMWVQVLHY